MTKIEMDAFRLALEGMELGCRDGNGNRESMAIEASPDELDRIQHGSERDYVMGNLERAYSRLREVNQALGRIDAGSFGICIVCEESIHPKRLAAVPWASCCIRCQEAADRQYIETPFAIAA